MSVMKLFFTVGDETYIGITDCKSFIANCKSLKSFISDCKITVGEEIFTVSDAIQLTITMGT